MVLRIVVLAKQVPDPEVPPSQFKVDESTNSVISPNGVPPVVNGFDLNAVEAALRLPKVLVVPVVASLAKIYGLKNPTHNPAASHSSSRRLLRRLRSINGGLRELSWVRHRSRF